MVECTHPRPVHYCDAVEWCPDCGAIRARNPDPGDWGRPTLAMTAPFVADRKPHDDFTRAERWIVDQGLARQLAGTIMHYALEKVFSALRGEIMAATLEAAPTDPDFLTSAQSHCASCVRCQTYRMMADHETRDIENRTVGAIVAYMKKTAESLRDEARDSRSMSSATVVMGLHHASAWERAAEFIETGHWKTEGRLDGKAPERTGAGNLGAPGSRVASTPAPPTEKKESTQ